MNDESASPDQVMSRRQEIRETWAGFAAFAIYWLCLGVTVTASPSRPDSMVVLAAFVVGLVSLYCLDRLLMGTWMWPLGPRRHRHRRLGGYWRWLAVMLVPCLIVALILWPPLEGAAEPVRSLRFFVPATAAVLAAGSARLISLARTPDWDVRSPEPRWAP